MTSIPYRQFVFLFGASHMVVTENKTQAGRTTQSVFYCPILQQVPVFSYEAIGEMLTLARTTDIRMNIAHIKVTGRVITGEKAARFQS